MKSFITAILLLVASSTSWSQTADIEQMPGFVNFSSLESIYGEPRIMININGTLMQLMAAAAASAKETDAAALMKDLQGIRVNVYDTAGELEPALAQMNEAKQILEDRQWQPIVQVKEEDENVQMFAQIEGELMQGMAIMVVNAEEAVFINILGEIDPSQIGKVMNQLNVDVDVDSE